MIVEGLMLGPRPHFPSTCSEGVGLRPGRFHIFTASPSNAVHVTKREGSLAFITVSVNVPGGDANLNLDIGVQLQFFGEVLHTMEEIFRPLTPNVVREDNTRELATSGKRDIAFFCLNPLYCQTKPKKAKKSSA
jgi:hypothetical protein